MHSIGGQKAKIRFSRRLVRRVQTVVITLASGDTTKQATLPFAVKKSKSFAVFLNLRTTQGTDASRYRCRVALDDDTHVSVTRNTASSAAQTVTAVICVVHLREAMVLNVAHGTVTVTAATSDFVTPAFTPTVDKDTLCIYLGNSSTMIGDSARLSKHQFDVAYTIGNNRVTATKGSSSDSGTVGYCLIQFAPGIIKSKNEALIGINTSASDVSATQAIAAVDMSKTVVFSGGFRYSEGFSGQDCSGYLDTSTQLKVERNAAYNFGTSPNARARLIAMEFNPQYIRALTRGFGDFTGDPQDVTIDLGSPYEDPSTMFNFTGFSMTNSFANTDYAQVAIEPSGDNIVFNRDSDSSTDTNIPKPRYEAVVFR